MSVILKPDQPFGSLESIPVIDQEQISMARICQEIEKYIDLGQRRRILQYVLDKTVDHIPGKT